MNTYILLSRLTGHRNRFHRLGIGCIIFVDEVNMGKFIIKGGAPLYGRVKVSGSKNASLAVLFATLITRGISEIRNLPDIGDVRVALDILALYGAKIKCIGDITYIDTRQLRYITPPSELTSRLRASTYLLGATLVRFGKAEKISLGGCSFSHRPIDMHIAAMISHGAEESRDSITAGALAPSEFSLRLPSVGATVNSLIMAAGIAGKSIIRGIALEPHILTLIDYLASAGAEIIRDGDTLAVSGGALGGGRVTIGADMIEAGSYLALGAMCGGRISVAGAVAEELLPMTDILSSAGVRITHSDGISALGRPERHISVVADPYPAFPTDLQPIMAPLSSFAGGKIRDNVWRGRYGYLENLKAFGIRSRVVDGAADIFPSEIHPASSSAPDLRGGMALVMAALVADGVSVIDEAEIIMRGYENIVGKLSRLGAEIEYRE